VTWSRGENRRFFQLCVLCESGKSCFGCYANIRKKLVDFVSNYFEIAKVERFLKLFLIFFLSKGDILKDACAPTQTREVKS